MYGVRVSERLLEQCCVENPQSVASKNTKKTTTPTHQLKVKSIQVRRRSTDIDTKRCDTIVIHIKCVSYASMCHSLHILFTLIIINFFIYIALNSHIEMVFFSRLILVVLMKSNDYDFRFGQFNIVIS